MCAIYPTPWTLLALVLSNYLTLPLTKQGIRHHLRRRKNSATSRRRENSRRPSCTGRLTNLATACMSERSCAFLSGRVLNSNVLRTVDSSLTVKSSLENNTKNAYRGAKVSRGGSVKLSTQQLSLSLSLLSTNTHIQQTRLTRHNGL